MAKKLLHPIDSAEYSAENGLLDRRLFLRGSALLGSMMGYGVAQEVAAEPLVVQPWMQHPGPFPRPYDAPSRFESEVIRRGEPSSNKIPELGTVRTPIHQLTGTMTPNGLHYVRVHTGVPDIDPAQHRLLIHGMVKRPLVFDVESLSRYPIESRIHFLECGGNSELIYDEHPAQVGVQRLHGQVSCAEWGGVPLSILMDEAGVDPRGKWIIAEGADACGLTRSIPMEKIMKDAMIALYQNGERLRPSNGYPMRLFLPGYEGNMNIKHVRRIKVIDSPHQSRDETMRYSMMRTGGISTQFNCVMEAKSVITQPAPELKMKGPGLYQISGLAWSGYGHVRRVDISADGGKTWAQADLQQPVRDLALTRFRLPWHWDGRPALLQSRVTDNTGYVQPTRADMIARRGIWANYHGNCITTWAIDANGEVKHVYA